MFFNCLSERTFECIVESELGDKRLSWSKSLFLNVRMLVLLPYLYLVDFFREK